MLQRGKREAANNGQFQQVASSGINGNHQVASMATPVNSVSSKCNCKPLVKSSQSKVKKGPAEGYEGLSTDQPFDDLDHHCH